MILALLAGCDPCPRSPSTELVGLLEHLDDARCLHRSDRSALRDRLETYHRQTTLHCDVVWRRSSPDGLSFSGPGEAVLPAASVADVFIDDAGRHVMAYNDLTVDRLPDLIAADPQRLWRQGLLGYGGLGLAIDSGEGFVEQEIDLHLSHAQEAVDPDLGQTADGAWRLVWFGVNPAEMNPAMHGPLASAKPHSFYRSTSTDLRDFTPPQRILASTAGSTGGADPTILDLRDGGELLLIGPLDFTTVGWRSPDGVQWRIDDPPHLDTRAPLATPDALPDPAGGYRLYGMKNGAPGTFMLHRSPDGASWDRGRTVMQQEGAFNASVARAPDGRWWLYYNVTDPDCLARYGSKRVLPGGGEPPPL